MPELALIGLGSNLGDRKAHLDLAVATLSDTPGILMVAVSTILETPPVGGPEGQGAFLNAAVRLETTLDAFALLKVLREIEHKAGRVRTVHWGERSLDLDLLILGTQTIRTPELTVPHPRLTLRRFVLAPLAEIAPEVVEMTTGREIAVLLANLDRRPSYVAIDAPAGKLRQTLFKRLITSLPAAGLSLEDVERDSNPRGLLRAAGWATELVTDSWLVTDFCFTHSLLNRISLAGPTANEWATDPGPWQATPDGRRVMEPTFVVAIPGGLFDRYLLNGPNPQPTGEVLLRPESQDVEGMVAEVLAACAATRAG